MNFRVALCVGNETVVAFVNIRSRSGSAERGISAASHSMRRLEGGGNIVGSAGEII